MIQMSFSEKLKILIDVSSSSGICIASIGLLIFMAFLFLTTNRKNAKSSKKLYTSIYIILLIIILIQYYSSLSEMYEYMMNNFFIVFYFPNLAIYLAAIIATNIILWKTIFNFKEDRLLKYINTTVYCMIHYLLILLLNIITTNKLDVFDQSSVYKNTSASALIGLSSTIFIVWIIFIIVYKMIRQSQKKHQKVKIPVRRIIRYKKKMPANFQSIELPNTLFGKAGSIKNQVSHAEYNLIDFYKNPAVINQNELLKQFENAFTLDDYKKMIETLKKEQDTSPTIVESNRLNESMNEELSNKVQIVEIIKD